MFQFGDFSPSNLFAGIIFGSIGLGAFIYGKKNAFWRPVVIGIMLMAYPYFFQGHYLFILSALFLL